LKIAGRFHAGTKVMLRIPSEEKLPLQPFIVHGELMAQGSQLSGEGGIIEGKAGYIFQQPQPLPGTVKVGIDDAP
jgi:hypothetical protein